MLKAYFVKGGGSAPVIVCDVCGRIIREAWHGLEVVDPTKEINGNAEGLGDLYHVHTGSCRDALMQKLPEAVITTESGLRIGFETSRELAVHLLLLTRNVNLPPAALLEFEQKYKRRGYDEGLPEDE